MSETLLHSLTAARDRMVAEQLIERDISSAEVLSALGRVPRERFVPLEFLAVPHDINDFLAFVIHDRFSGNQENVLLITGTDPHVGLHADS